MGGNIAATIRIVTLSCGLLFASAAAWAADSQLRINSASVDCESGTLTLAGDFGDPAMTTVALTLDVGHGPQPLGQVGRTATQVIVELPDRKCEPAGTHRLSVDLVGQASEKVQTTSGIVRPVQFHNVLDLTLGAVGPRGEAGARGEPGESGQSVLIGQSCPQGTFVTGFGANAAIVCSGGTGPSGHPPTVIVSLIGQAVTRHITPLSVMVIDIDPDESFRYDAKVASQPPGSQVVFANPLSPSPAFLATLPGMYQLTGSVTDSTGNVGPWSLVVQVGSCATGPPIVTTFKIIAVSRPSGSEPPVETLQCTLSAPGDCDVQLTNLGTDAVRIEITAEDPSAAACFTAPSPSLQSAFATVPSGVQVQLIGDSTPQPWFVPPAPGVYVLSVKATGGENTTSEYGVILIIQPST